MHVFLTLPNDITQYTVHKPFTTFLRDMSFTFTSFWLAVPQARESNQRIWDIGKVYFYLFLELRTIPTPRDVRFTASNKNLVFLIHQFPSHSRIASGLRIWLTGTVAKRKMILKKAMNSFVRNEKPNKFLSVHVHVCPLSNRKFQYTVYTQSHEHIYKLRGHQRQEQKEGQAVFPMDFCNQTKIAFASCLSEYMLAVSVRPSASFPYPSQSGEINFKIL